ncbi:MAG: hypothetical protein OJF55_002397 [Rhodanobacteraceae bacterium]|nr:MAG: hypothetical protein OJF55_002397 [Rhodanobacteraceae bacterium]
MTSASAGDRHAVLQEYVFEEPATASAGSALRSLQCRFPEIPFRA